MTQLQTPAGSHSRQEPATSGFAAGAQGSHRKLRAENRMPGSRLRRRGRAAAPAPALPVSSAQGGVATMRLTVPRTSDAMPLTAEPFLRPSIRRLFPTPTAPRGVPPTRAPFPQRNRPAWGLLPPGFPFCSVNTVARIVPAASVLLGVVAGLHGKAHAQSDMSTTPANSSRRRTTPVVGQSCL